MDWEECVNYLLTTAQHHVHERMSQLLAPYGITPGQYGVLNCLWNKRGDTPKELAQTLNLETSTVSGLLDKMQRRGVIDRIISEADRRVVRIILTDEGCALQEPVLAVIRQVNSEVLSGFTSAESEALLAALRAIIYRN